MVLLVTAGVAAVKGGIAAKQHIETRKNPTLDGDFITAPLSSAGTTKGGHYKHEQRKTSWKDNIRTSLTNVARSVQVGTISTKVLQPSLPESGCKTRQPAVSYQLGQEVRLQYMSDSRLNGRTALVMQDFGPQGVLVQFTSSLESQQQQQHADQEDSVEINGLNETGIYVLPENLEPMEESTSTSSCDAAGASSSSPAATDSATTKVGTGLPHPGSFIELQHLSKASDKNGQRGIVVIPPMDMVLGKGRVAVKLFESNGTISLEGGEGDDGNGQNLISVKLENCKVIDDSVW